MAVKLKKLEAALPEDFVKTAKEMSEDSDKCFNLILELNENIEKLKEQRRNDPTKKDLTEKLKALNNGYKDLIKLNENKIKYLLLLLKDKQGDNEEKNEDFSH